MKRFNLRVYGIFINSKDEVLVADENRFGKSFSKFPGGGLEWGEGLKECLSREIYEELGITVEVGEPFYVTDYFQISAFNSNDQLISSYYLISKFNESEIEILEHDVPLKEEGEFFRWIPLDQLSEDIFTFPIDKIVAKKLADL